MFRASKSLLEEFATVQEEYFKQRADDIRDVSFQLIRALLGFPEVSLADVPPNSIVIARNLNPSDTATIKRGKYACILYRNRQRNISHGHHLAQSRNTKCRRVWEISGRLHGCLVDRGRRRGAGA